jgi:flavin-binding protein dodecin
MAPEYVDAPILPRKVSDGTSINGIFSPDPPGVTVSDRTYRVTEIVGTSPDGIDQAIRNGIDRASRTLRHLDWFEVTQVRGQVKDDAVEHFQVGLKLGFRLEDD